MLTQLSQLLHINVCTDVEDINHIWTLHTLIPHLISVFEDWEAKVEVLWIPKLNSPFCQNRDRVVHSI